MSNGEYVELRHKARKVPDFGRYSLEQAQMNPMIFEFMLAAMEGVSKTIWEPFSAPSSDIFRFIAKIRGFGMLSFGLTDAPGIELCDSTCTIPSADYGGVLFHPPYYGSSPQSGHEGDLSLCEDWDKYRNAISMAMRSSVEVLVEGGILVAIGRDYREKTRVRLDHLYWDIMKELSVEVEEVWISEPDIILVARKKS